MLWYVAAAGFLIAAIAIATTGQWLLAAGLAAIAVMSLVLAVRAGQRGRDTRS
jgi:membrane protein implicated in regulation of membrane protease activity